MVIKFTKTSLTKNKKKLGEKLSNNNMHGGPPIDPL
jgi:hypothetical protein